jgi:GNAT superfamily N-acetyltransferase
VIRPLTVTDDRDEYADLAIRAFGPKDPADLWARTVPTIADGRGLGAFDDGRLVGAALFHDLRQWWLGRVVPAAGVAGVKVAPEYRGRGAGRALMTALTGLMTSRGYPLAVLYPATMPIYRQLGWEEAGVRYVADIPGRSLLTLAGPDLPAARPARQPPLRRPGPADAAERLAATSTPAISLTWRLTGFSPTAGIAAVSPSTPSWPPHRRPPGRCGPWWRPIPPSSARSAHRSRQRTRSGGCSASRTPRSPSASSGCSACWMLPPPSPPAASPRPTWRFRCASTTNRCPLTPGTGT